MTRDTLGNVTAIQNPLGGITAQNYDEFSRVSSVQDALGRGVTLQYNNLDLPTVIEDPFGMTRLTYDELGRTTSVTDADGNLTRYLYDPATGDLLSTIQGLVESRYSYDRFGNLTSIADPNGVVTAFEYDAMNRLIRTGSAAEVPLEVVEVAVEPVAFNQFRIITHVNKALESVAFKYRPQGESYFTTLLGTDILSNSIIQEMTLDDPEAVYEYLIEATDLEGNTVSTELQTFRTPPILSTYPVILTNRIESTGMDSATFSVHVASGTFVGQATLQVTPFEGGETITLNQAIVPGANNVVVLNGLDPAKEYRYTLLVQNVVGDAVYPLRTEPIRGIRRELHAAFLADSRFCLHNPIFLSS
jgi:YD repeat-containing protein